MAIFRFFKMAAVGHHGFLNFHNFNGQHVGGTKCVYPYQISLRSIEPLLRYGDFSIFRDGGRRHAGFLKFEIFNGRTRQKLELRHFAKFGQNLSNHGRDMVIFRFFKMAPSAILHF